MLRQKWGYLATDMERISRLSTSNSPFNLFDPASRRPRPSQLFLALMVSYLGLFWIHLESSQNTSRLRLPENFVESKFPGDKKQKQVVLKFLLDNEPSFVIEYTRNGNPKPESYDKADS
jgi:hypothetical protein